LQNDSKIFDQTCIILDFK